MPSTSFDPAKDIPDLHGKVIIVTGGNAGIGKATISALAQHNPSRIYLCARRRAAADEAAAELSARHNVDNIHVLDLDLASLESVKQCAAEFNKKEDRLDMLFLNAGVASTPPALTKEGYESQFGINHIGHALLTQLLMPKLLSTRKNNPGADVRIILASSQVAVTSFVPKGGLALDRMREAGPFSPISLYAHSKAANVHFGRKLTQLYPNILSTAAHPGFVKSDIWDKSGGGIVNILFRPILWLTGVDNDQGAKTQLWCAVTPRDGKAGVEGGQLYLPIGKLCPFKGPNADQKLTNELWEWTNKELAKHGGGEWPSA